ncbi:MAG: TatD family hydrolase, partial [Myxococcales bacterium]|nr:TatD family hydrolase [Myxococcales bacterium]
LDSPAFDADRAAVLARARAAGVGGFVLAGVEPAAFAGQRTLAAREPGMVWTAGLHPQVAAELDAPARKAALDALPAAFVGANPARAVGETGLDRHFVPKATLPGQTEVFRAQLAFARERNLPVVLHIVGAHGPALDVLRRDGLPAAGGMVHSFGGNAELVREYVALGLHLSFAGPVARAHAPRLHEAARATPADRLLIETDAPDQSPPDLPRRNEPAVVRAVAAAVAALRGEDPVALLKRAARNLEALLGPFIEETSCPA